jgi:hypothetical protein
VLATSLAVGVALAPIAAGFHEEPNAFQLASTVLATGLAGLVGYLGPSGAGSAASKKTPIG